MSMASNKVIGIIFLVFTFSEVLPAKAQTWIRAGYWFSGSEFPSSDITSSLFTHLICAFASVNSTSYQLSLYSPSDEAQFSSFTQTVKQKNPSITTLLSIGGGNANYSSFASLVSTPSYRKSFIDSSLKTARRYGFQGLDLSWVSANTSSDMFHMGILFEEWRAAAESEAKNTSQAQLILTAAVQFTPGSDFATFPTESIQKNLDWVHVLAFDYYMPEWANFTGAHAALYDPSSSVNTDYGIRAWINSGVSPNKLVLALPFYGYAWTLVKPEDTGIGAPAKGPAITDAGDMSYKDVKSYIGRYNAKVVYNATYVVNYCTIGKSWIGFDGVEVVKVKVSYAKEKKLLGYVVWQVPYDDHWVLSQAAALEDDKMKQSKGRLLSIILPTTAAAFILLCSAAYCCWMRNFKSKGTVGSAIKPKSKATHSTAAEDFNNSVPDLRVYSLAEVEAATDNFSFENKLGEGGYGPVYKGVLPDGQEIAVKKLSKMSTQGYEEFSNKVMLTAKLQHINLVRVLGFCTDREEQMLIYEYMPNKSLDYYLFGLKFCVSIQTFAMKIPKILILHTIELFDADPIRRYLLDWRKRVHIIEGVTQGLLYLQDYSRLTIVHRDLKASNVLLDDNMKPKISDFGMARIFAKDDLEANTGKIVGTYGYIPPEYVKRGMYSFKSDVYSFGVLLLQIISGQRVSLLYGVDDNLSLLEHAYELWKDGKGMEIMDPTLEDTQSSCKLTRCLQIALLCVQENPNDRPSMLEIFSLLKNETVDAMMIPKKPAFSKETVENERKKSRLPTHMISVNDVTVSEVVAR